MPSIDERVVAMSFENQKFETKVAATMGTLEKLDRSIRNVGQTSGLSKIEAQSNKITFNGVHRAIDSLSAKFGKMQLAAGVAFGNIATMAITKIGGAVKSLSLDPLLQGFSEYSTNLTSIQTILANTQDSGGNLKTVNAALQELNRYSDQTIYNFGQMAKNIGTFTAAGVRLKPATESIKGIANLAALSGSNSEQASTAMYQLSQAIAAGRVGLQDWNSVVNAGMGGAVFQKALMRTAENMGAIKKGAVQIDKATGKATVNGKSFRESIMAKPGEVSWLSGDVLVKTLQQFTGDLSDAQLKAQGFNDEQIKAIQRTATSAKKAATEVKTISGVFDVVKESIGSGWSSTFQIIFGNFNESKKTFTNLSNFINGFVSRTFGAFDGILRQWKKLGGRTELIKGIKRAFDDLVRVVKPIRDAFREIFPAKTGRDLFKMTKDFTDLMKALKPSAATVKDLKRIFVGVFSVFHIGIGIIKEAISRFKSLFDQVGGGSGDFLDFAAHIGDLLNRLDKFLIAGGGLERFLDRVGDKLQKPIALLKQFAGVVKDFVSGLFGKTDAGGGIDTITNSLHGLSIVLKPFGLLLDAVTWSWNMFTKAVGKVKDILSPLLDEVASVVATFGSKVAAAIKNANYDMVFAAINTVLLGGIFLAIRKVLQGGFGVKGALSVDLGGGFLKNLNKTFEALNGNLVAMQKNIQANTLLQIALALGVLAVSIAILATINPKDLAAAMTALAVGMGELVGAMGLLNKAAGGSAFARMPFVAGSLILLAGAMILLAVAAKIFATMSWDEIERGLAAVAGMLAAVGAATQLMNPIKMLAAGAAMVPIALAITLLAVAAELFAHMSWKQIGKGLAAIGGMLLAIGIAMNAFPPTAALMGPSLVLIAIAIDMLVGSVLAFGHMDQKVLAKGILSIAGALVAIGLAVNLMPPTLPLIAIGLVILGVALAALTGVVLAFGKMKTETVVRGILGMGGALVVLAIGLTAMSGTLAGAAALQLAAGAFAILIPALSMLGGMSWSTIFRGMAAMIVVLLGLAAAGVIAGPALIALGVGLGAIGVGLVLIAASMYLFAKGLSLLSDTGVKAFAALLVAAAAFIAAFPIMLIQFIKGVVTTLEYIVKIAPKIVTALVKILGQLLVGIIDIAPKAAKAIEELILQILKIINDNAVPIIKAGFDLLVNFLSGIANNIGRVTANVALIIINFLDALEKKMPRLVAAGLHLLNSFLRGIINGLPKLVTTVAKLITTFLDNLTKHIPDIVKSAVTLITKFIKALADQIPQIIDTGVSIITNLLTGIENAIPKLLKKALHVAKVLVTNIALGLVTLVDTGATAIINFLNGLAPVIRKREPQIIMAGTNVALAIGEGLIDGLIAIGPIILHKVADLGKKMAHTLSHPWEVVTGGKKDTDSGKALMEGLAKSIEQNSPKVDDAIKASAKKSTQTTKKEFGKVPKALEHVDSKPVIRPVLDLSHVRKNAPAMRKMLAVPPIGVRSSNAASTIASQQKDVKPAAAAQAPPAPNVHFEQNNYSPESLSTVEIYRQTHNQISRAKGLLKVP